MSAPERTAGCLAIVLLTMAMAIAASPAGACSVSVPWVPYVNVVGLTGDKVAGLKWVRMYNILDYEGGERVLVSGVRQGVRFPLAKWENGQECSFSAAGEASCHPNRPGEGISVEGNFPGWKDAAARASQLPRVWLPLIVEVGGREVRMTLRSQAVRTTRKLQGERSGRIVNEVCAAMEEAN